jgi:hypothetical protein
MSSQPNGKRRVVVAPEVLPNRPLLKVNSYESDGEGYSIDSVGVTFGSGPKSKNRYIAPTGLSNVAETLRRYVLIRSRYSLPDVEKYAKRWEVSPGTIHAANRIVSNHRYIHTFGEDPSIGTSEVKVLASVLGEGDPPKQALLALMSHQGTRAYYDALRLVNDPLLETDLSELYRSIDYFMYDRHLVNYLPRINHERSDYRKQGLKYWKYFVQQLDQMMNIQRGVQADRREEGDKVEVGEPKVHPKPRDLQGEWEPLVVAKPELSVNHTGKLGRRVIAADSGREPRYINRIVTDPERRIFSRKTRALGGVVVIDCSGSMRLSEDDLDRLLKASSGATVLCYSGGYNHPTKPNVWVVARKGRMMRKLPEFPGDNAVDGPAIVYASTLRDNGGQPLIWVSDGYVTGINTGTGDEKLQKDMDYIKRRHRVIQVETVQEAEALMKRLQGGSR